MLQKRIGEFEFCSTQEGFDRFHKQLEAVNISEAQIIEFLERHKFNSAISVEFYKEGQTNGRVKIEDKEGKELFVGSNRTELTFRYDGKTAVYKLEEEKEVLVTLNLFLDNGIFIYMSNREGFFLSGGLDEDEMINMKVKKGTLTTEEMENLVEATYTIIMKNYDNLKLC